MTDTVIPLRPAPRELSPVAAALIERIRAADAISPIVTAMIGVETQKDAACMWVEPPLGVTARGWLMIADTALDAFAEQLGA